VDFGTYTNLALSLAVTLYGIYWIFRPTVRIDYRYRAYCYWWCSWLAWVLAWSLILIKQGIRSDALNNSLNYIPILETFILIFDNLNSIFLITVYFILTRGRDLTASQARIQTFLIALSLAIAFGAMYLLFYLNGNVKFAYEMHRTCSLCISVFTPILVGWSFNLRFKTSAALMVGCIYGFIQPIVYATELPKINPTEFPQRCIIDLQAVCATQLKTLCVELTTTCEFEKNINGIRPIVTMIIGFLKVVWAITCTKILSSAYASSKNLIVAEESEPSSFWKRWWPSVSMYATILISIYFVILISAIMKFYIQELGSFAIAIGVITGIISLWQVIWSVWKKTRNM
jgi:hypothetical protein